MKKLAIIPARGGSKRLPGKNTLDFRGQPIIAHTINAALQSGCFDKIIVSTEDEHIAEVALRFGSEVLKRSPELASDTARVVDVCSRVIEDERSRGRDYEAMCCLYATSPLRNAEDIRNTVALLQPGECDFAMAITRYYYSPHQALRPDSRGYLQPVWPTMINLQSQAAGEMLVDNGSTYAVVVSAFLREKSFYGPDLRGYVMPRQRSVDIDDLQDFELAELYAEKIGL